LAVDRIRVTTREISAGSGTIHAVAQTTDASTGKTSIRSENRGRRVGALGLFGATGENYGGREENETEFLDGEVHIWTNKIGDVD
jgi:hypothetical protein